MFRLVCKAEPHDPCVLSLSLSLNPNFSLILSSLYTQHSIKAPIILTWYQSHLLMALSNQIFRFSQHCLLGFLLSESPFKSRTPLQRRYPLDLHEAARISLNRCRTCFHTPFEFPAIISTRLTRFPCCQVPVDISLSL